MNKTVLAAIRAHANECFPRESCGLIVLVKGEQRYMPCRNVAESANEFQIHGEDYAGAEDLGTIVKVVHSHPNHAPTPSEADLVGCEESGLPWVIVNSPDGHFHEFAPTGYSAPLIGRSYVWGVLDCYSLMRDYYQRELGIELPNYERDELFWKNGQNMFMDNLADAGFVEVPHAELRQHDVILMQVMSPHMPNHAAIYVDDMVILHHCMNRLSSRDVYGGYWQRCAFTVIRHRSLLDA